MSQLRISLDPNRLVNPDLDIRYELPARLAAIPGSTLADNGYDYSEDSPPLLLIFLKSDRPSQDAELAIEFLGSCQVLENDVLAASTICISDDAGEWSQVFPT